MICERRSSNGMNTLMILSVLLISCGVLKAAQFDVTKLKINRVKLNDPLKSEEYEMEYALFEFPSTITKEQQKDSTKYSVSSKSEIKMRLELSSSESLLGINPPNNWGVNCADVNPDQFAQVCQMTGKKPTDKVMYQGSQLTGIEYVKVQEGVFPSSASNFPYKPPAWEVMGLMDKTTTGNTSFVLNDTGVLGLGPGSKFIDYLLTTDQDLKNRFSFTVDYPIAPRSSAREKKVPSNPEFYFNATDSSQIPGIRELTSVGIFKADFSLPSAWHFSGITLKIGNQQIALDSPLLCISNTAQKSVIYVRNPSEISAAIYKQMCDSNTACKLDSVSFEKAPQITLTQTREGGSNPEIKLIGEEYLSDGGSGLYQESVGDINTIIAAGKCSPDSQIALGSQLFNGYLGYFTVKRIQSDNILQSQAQLELFRKKLPTRLNSQQKFYFMLVSAGMIVIISLITAIKHLSIRKLNQQELGRESWIKATPTDPSVYGEEDNDMDNRSLIQN